MILESRFAPSISARSKLVVTLLALLVLPSFVATAKSQDRVQAPTTRTAARTDAPVLEFPHVVRFEQGVMKFADGDNITIEEIRGTADSFKPGNLYWIKGTYKLGSHESASLAAYITASKAGEGRGVPTYKVQTTLVERGAGSFTLVLPMPYQGWPHVSYYPAGGGEGFGGNYFGTGDSVLKKWWGEK